MIPCKEWTGGLNKVGGYGRRMINGRRGLVHRLTWEEAFGPIPGGLEVCHRCDNKRCYEIEHLFLGTHQDNMADMVQKGRTGSRATSKLGPSQVAEIRRRKAAGEAQKDLAEEFGVARPTISNIVRNITWRSAA